ncbi:MAG: hypothetical protein FJY42_12915 [Betaproteobacteria bacterium]|nr:hypothetical protein [Betaproteobacteria bacterium]
MQSPILDALPSIHTTVIGFGGAFFSAFALYAYQKVQKTKDQLERVLRDVQAFSTPSNYIGTQADLLLETGELDWDGKAKRVIHDSKSLFSFLDYEEKYGIPRNTNERQPSDEQVVLACRSLCLALHYVFVSYPFSGRSMVHVQGVTEKLEEKKQELFDEKRLREISRRIGFLGWCWNGSNRALLELGKRCTEIEQRNAHEQQMAAFNANMERIKDLSELERERIWKIFHAPRLNHSIDYAQIISDYFSKVLAYEANVLPALIESLRVHDLYNGRFKVRKLSIWIIWLTIYLLAVGVLTPPIMRNLEADYDIWWHPGVEYALLIFTSAPYFAVCAWLLQKIKTSTFR